MNDNEWCPASGSEDEYRPLPELDIVQCFECNRFFYLTKWLRMPRHKTAVEK